MNPLPLSAQTHVQDALQTAPAISRVFLKHRTSCVGCLLARFCTLSDVAHTYGLSPEALLSELEQAARANPSTLIGAHNEESH